MIIREDLSQTLEILGLEEKEIVRLKAGIYSPSEESIQNIPISLDDNVPERIVSYEFLIMVAGREFTVTSYRH